MQQTDFLVIGSGIAGLSYALKVAERFPEKKVLVMTKAAADETNTKYAQGGIAVVNDLENDSYEKHIDDTLIAGDGLCNEKVVEIVVKEGPERVNDIIEWELDLIKKKTANTNVAAKADIRNSGYCIIKILRVGKWKERY